MDVSRSAQSLNTIRTKGRTICAKGNRFRNELSSSAQPSGRSCSISPAVSACVYCCSGFGLQSAISRGRGVGFTRQQMFQKPKRETQLGIGGARPKLVFKLASLLRQRPNQAVSCWQDFGCKSYTESEEAAESIGFHPFALRSCLARSSNRLHSPDHARSASLGVGALP